MNFHYIDLKRVHFEPTQKCQAMCPMCDRTLNQHIKDVDFTVDNFKSCIWDDFKQQLTSFLFCGNHGDPIISNHTLPIIEHLRDVNPNLKIDLITNGGARKSDFWKSLAKLDVNVTFSVDGLWDTNHLYRVNVNWDNVESSMDAFTQAGGKGRWDYLIFEHNEHQIDEAEQIAKMFGLTFVKKKTGRWVQAYKQKKVDEKITVKGNKVRPAEKKENQNKSVNEYDLLIERHGSFDKYLDQTEINCKSLQANEIYISAEGLVTPCCWTASRFYKMYERIGENQIYKFVNDMKKINILHTPMRAIVEGDFFQNLSASWNIKSCKKGKAKICAEKCGIGYTAFKDQYE